MMAELERLRQIHRSLSDVISQMEAEQQSSPSILTRTVRLGDARSMAVLAAIDGAGGSVSNLEFETILARFGRTLRGAGGFLGGAGASVRRDDGKFSITSAGKTALEKWKLRYGSKWLEELMTPEALGDRAYPDNSRVTFKV
ncbi:MAG: hypothetical protein FWC66_05555 [Oscillospiraceae bacterium]|nr:hypothetical protein [Oscillospiraceae bacterium]